MPKNIFKILQLIRCPDSSMCNRYNFEKSYLPQKGIVFKYFICLRSISRSIELKKISNQIQEVICYFIFTKRFWVSRTRWKQSPPKHLFISSILELLSNSNKILNSSSRSEENHTSFGFLFNYSKVSKMNFKVKGSVFEWKLAARKSFESQLDIDL